MSIWKELENKGGAELAKGETAVKGFFSRNWHWFAGMGVSYGLGAFTKTIVKAIIG